jgi:uncharacterized protein (TIGR02300 family)
VAKPELGTKRLCASCGAKFYDLNKDPIVCPKCETVFAPVVAVTRGRPEAARAVPKEAEVVAPETAEAEFVSLEDADAEAAGGKKAAVPVVEGEDDIEIDEALDDDDDDTFIEETEEGDADVTDIIGDVADEEET